MINITKVFGVICLLFAWCIWLSYVRIFVWSEYIIFPHGGVVFSTFVWLFIEGTCRLAAGGNFKSQIILQTWNLMLVKKNHFFCVIFVILCHFIFWTLEPPSSELIGRVTIKATCKHPYWLFCWFTFWVGWLWLKGLNDKKGFQTSLARLPHNPNMCRLRVLCLSF